MASNNKVEYGLSQLWFAKLTATTGEDGNVTYTYATPVRLFGAQTITCDPSGDSNSFYADDTKYFTYEANNGYEGEVGMIMITDVVRTEIFNQVRDSNGNLVELTDVMPNEGALLWQCQGDKNKVRHILYNCSFGRGSEESKTQEKGIEPTTGKFSYTSAPIELADGHKVVKARCTEGDANYANFFTQVTPPTLTQES